MNLATAHISTKEEGAQRNDTKSLVIHRFPAHVLPKDDTKHAPERLSSCVRAGVSWDLAGEPPSQESLDRQLKELHERYLATRGGFRLVDTDSKTVVEAPLVPAFASDEAGSWLTKTEQEIELHTGQAYTAILSCDEKRHKNMKQCVVNFTFVLADKSNSLLATNDAGTVLVRWKHKRQDERDVVLFDQAEWRKTCE